MFIPSGRSALQATTKRLGMVNSRALQSARKCDPAPVYDSILDTIGCTPVVSLGRTLEPWQETNSLEIMLKLESTNPGWSVKARPALNMLEQAERRGVLKPGMRIIESSSGNTAIAMAMAAAVKGYQFQPVVDARMPSAKLDLLRIYGANPIVVGNSPDEDMSTLKIERRRLVDSFKNDPECWVPDQYNNPDNAGVHMLTTGPEFVAQCDADLDLVVVVMSTGGQIGGFGRYMKENIPGCRLLAVEPTGSTIFANNGGSYMNTGGGLDYKPSAVLELEKEGLIDRAVTVDDEDALAVCRTVAQHEGILVGPSTGSALFAALDAASQDSSIKRVGLLGCDDGRAYMSSIMEQFNPLLDTPTKLHERVQSTPVTEQDLEFSPNYKIDWKQHSGASTSLEANQPPQARHQACTTHGCQPVDGRASAHMAGTDPPTWHGNTMRPQWVHHRDQHDEVEPKTLRKGYA